MENKTMKHWLIVLIASGLAGSSLGINMNVMGVFYQPIASDLNLLTGTVAMQGTLGAIMISVVGIFINRILSVITFKKMIVIGTLLSAAATAGMAFVSTPLMLNLFGILRGTGSGLIGVVTFTILINNWFEEKNGLALSITASVAGLVGVILSPILTWAIESYGWRTALLVVAACFILFNLPALLLPIRLNPRDEGLLAYGEIELDSTDLNQEEFEPTKTTSIQYTGILFITLVFLALFYPLSTGFSQNLPGFAVASGFDLNFGATLLSAAMAANILFKLVLGSVANVIGPVKTTIGSTIVLIVAFLLLLSGGPSWLILLGAFLYGICYFVPSLALPILTRSFFGKYRANRVYPLIAFFAGVSGALSMSMIGYIYDFTQSYAIAIWVNIIVAALSVVFLFFAKREQDKQEKVGHS